MTGENLLSLEEMGLLYRLLVFMDYRTGLVIVPVDGLNMGKGRSKCSTAAPFRKVLSVIGRGRRLSEVVKLLGELERKGAISIVKVGRQHFIRISERFAYKGERKDAQRVSHEDGGDGSEQEESSGFPYEEE